jgi:hypothetical protein
LGQSDVERLRENLTYLRRLDDRHGSAAVYEMTAHTFRRLRGLVERARYDEPTGQGLRAPVGETASRIGWLDFDAGRHEDARRWQLEALSWAQLADADSVRIGAMAAMARLTADDCRPRQAIDLATAAQRTAGRGEPAAAVDAGRSRSTRARWRG